LRKIQALSSIKFYTDESIKNETISININNADIETALKRILTRYNKCYEYNSEGNLAQISVLGLGLGHEEKHANTSSAYFANQSKQSFPAIIDTTQEKQEVEMEWNTSIKNNNDPKLVIVEENPDVMPVENTIESNQPPGKTEKNIAPMEVTESYQLFPGQN
jgi:hypothetical protein